VLRLQEHYVLPQLALLLEFALAWAPLGLARASRRWCRVLRCGALAAENFAETVTYITIQPLHRTYSAQQEE
jgi:hypothetical protein